MDNPNNPPKKIGRKHYQHYVRESYKNLSKINGTIKDFVNLFNSFSRICRKNGFKLNRDWTVSDG